MTYSQRQSGGKNEGYFHLDSLTMQHRQHSARSVLLTLSDTRREYFNLYAIVGVWQMASIVRLPLLHVHTFIRRRVIVQLQTRCGPEGSRRI